MLSACWQKPYFHNGRLLRARAIAIASAGRENLSANEEDGYWTLKAKVEASIEVKKSKFLATAWPIKTSKQAMQLIASAQDLSASHNCFAYKLEEEFRASDDGEPGGTAGKPILSAITGEDLNGTCVLVTRFFGGTKLGVGGLVRAYGGAARECLRSGERTFVRPSVTLDIKAGYESIGIIYTQIELHRGELVREDYDAHGNVVVKTRVQRSAVAAMNSGLMDASSGLVTATLACECAEDSDD